MLYVISQHLLYRKCCNKIHEITFFSQFNQNLYFTHHLLLVCFQRSLPLPPQTHFPGNPMVMVSLETFSGVKVPLLPHHHLLLLPLLLALVAIDVSKWICTNYSRYFVVVEIDFMWITHIKVSFFSFFCNTKIEVLSIFESWVVDYKNLICWIFLKFTTTIIISKHLRIFI